MSLKAKLEAIVYATEAPVTLDQIIQLVKDSVVAETPQENGPIDDTEVRRRVRAALEELVAEFSSADHGVEIRQVAGLLSVTLGAIKTRIRDGLIRMRDCLGVS